VLVLQRHARQLASASLAKQSDQPKRGGAVAEAFRADVREAVAVGVGAPRARVPGEVHAETVRRTQPGAFPNQHHDESRAEEEAISRADAALVNVALGRLSEADRQLLLAHEVEGRDTAGLAADRGSTPGAVAARLLRTRARLRVEYLIAQAGTQPPTDRCRPVLLALSAADRRRQADLDVTGHLLACDWCAELSVRLLERRPAHRTQDGEQVPVARDADVVLARQKAREAAARAGFTGTDLTLIATAVSEIARNIVKFARRGQFSFTVITEPRRTGLLITARDSGPGITDLDRAMRDGYSTYRGLGIGLPGARRLMDQFDIATEVGKGTTVTMTKWRG